MAKGKSPLGLGKGLDALLPSEVLSRAGQAENVQPDDGKSVGITALIDIALIKVNPLQPREDFDQAALEELKNSIREKGVIQPITVRRRDGEYEIIAGERRFRACKANGYSSIPAYIIDVETDAEMLELALIENVQREHLNPIEEALGYQRLIDECGLTQEEVARKVGKERSTVANTLRLLRLSEEIRLSLRGKEISMGQARTLLGLSDTDLQNAVFHRVLEEDLSVRKTEELVRKVNDGASVDVSLGEQKKKGERPKKNVQGAQGLKAAANPELASTLKDIESHLQQLLGTKVHVRSKADGEGAVEIKFYSTEELERLLDIFAIIEREQFD